MLRLQRSAGGPEFQFSHIKACRISAFDAACRVRDDGIFHAYQKQSRRQCAVCCRRVTYSRRTWVQYVTSAQKETPPSVDFLCPLSPEIRGFSKSTCGGVVNFGMTSAQTGISFFLGLSLYFNRVWHTASEQVINWKASGSFFLFCTALNNDPIRVIISACVRNI